MTKINENWRFLRNTLFTDECTCISKTRGNPQNDRSWDVESPHKLKMSKCEYNLKLNVWAGTIGDKIIEPFFIENMNKFEYLDLLINK